MSNMIDKMLGKNYFPSNDIVSFNPINDKRISLYEGFVICQFSDSYMEIR